jgi:8-oxo-dGTP pyrophosphatase MutT (NUDIX family)
MSLTNARTVIADLTARVMPLDGEEADAQATMLVWIGAGAPLFRTAPPDIPPMHLAVYVVLLDAGGRAVLLVDHIKAGLWLPPGGHVDPDEDPRATAVREGKEELGLDIDFHEGAGDRPFFLTVTATRGPRSHTDATFWFVARGDRSAPVSPDLREFREVRWFDLDGTNWSAPTVEPNLRRFVDKLHTTTSLIAPAASA